MIRPTPMVDPDLVDLTPQAVVRKPVSYFAKKFTNFVRGQDHFDAFEGGSFLLNDKITFAVIRYSGHPPDTATIYIDSRVKKHRNDHCPSSRYCSGVRASERCHRVGTHRRSRSIADGRVQRRTLPAFPAPSTRRRFSRTLSALTSLYVIVVRRGLSSMSHPCPRDTASASWRVLMGSGRAL